MKSIIVTGASGFIGRNLLLKLSASKDVIYAVYNKDASFPKFLRNYNVNNVRPIRCDLTNVQQVRKLQKLNVVFDLGFHFAANSNPSISTEDPFFDLISNVGTTINLLKNIRIRRLVYLSSGAVYYGLKGKVSPNSAVSPLLPYAISKLSSEFYIRWYSEKLFNPQEYIILRFFGAYGPFEPERKIFTQMIKKFYFEKSTEFKIRGDGNNLIDAMYVDDAIEGILKVATTDKIRNIILDFCVGSPVTVNELVKKVAEIFNVNSLRILHEGTVPEYNEFIGSPEEFRRLTGFTPKISLREGILKFKNFLEKNLRY
ncbi:MAG: NAD-dependent epimerase/dehydratase family protein [Thermoproteota archaeon]